MNHRTRTDELNEIALRPPLRIRAQFEPAGDGGWYCTDSNTYDGAPDAGPIASACGHGPTKDAALKDLLEQIDGQV